MIAWLSNSTISRLRDQLRKRGQKPQLTLPENVTADRAETFRLLEDYGPLCDAMYMMMSADGSVSASELEVLTGALRNLSGDTLRALHIDALLEAAAKKTAEDGREKRMQDIILALQQDTTRGEVAFVLAAAIAFADNAIADQEHEVLNQFAEGLGIDEERADELLESVEEDLRAMGG
jgi:uncharacterized tellurite resistance protein B-like protein